MWRGAVTCLQCSSPILHDSPSTFPELIDGDVSIDMRYVRPHIDANLNEWRRIIGKGRKVTGLKSNVQFFIPLPKDREAINRAEEYNRSLKRQGGRYDANLLRQFNSSRRYGTCSYISLDERIENDFHYRMKLASRIVNCNAQFAPAQSLFSQYCKAAFELAIRNDEISYEQIGKRMRQGESWD